MIKELVLYLRNFTLYTKSDVQKNTPSSILLYVEEVPPISALCRAASVLLFIAISSITAISVASAETPTTSPVQPQPKSSTTLALPATSRTTPSNIHPWSVVVTYPIMYSDAANGTRVGVSIDGAVVHRNGVDIRSNGEISVGTGPSTSSTPVLEVGTYRLTLALKNATNKTLKAYTTTDWGVVPNPATGTFVSSCQAPGTNPTSAATNITVTCSFDFVVKQPGHINTFVLMTAPVTFVSATFQRL